jgi:hypothetical protein
MNFKQRIALLTLLLSSFSSSAFLFKGKVLDEKQQPLPFTSIYVKNTSLGTTSNTNGEFSIDLALGRYEVVFRYLGYETLTKIIEIKNQDLVETIDMKPTVLVLADAIVKKQKEDPALTIMRKTIAMSVFHYKELASYSFRSYMKGNLKVVDIPALLSKALEKQFFKKNQLYVFEYVGNVVFKSPNSFSQKIVASKDNLPPNLKGSVSFQMGKYEIYSPDNEYSPVTKKGAKHYRYEYLGYFVENGQTINRIKVIPKVKNAGYSGVLNVIDDSWYIHSYDFEEYETGMKSNTKALFQPIDGVWVLNSLVMSGEMDYLGIALDLKATISIKNFILKKDPKYAKIKPEIIDEKLFKEEAKKVNPNFNKPEKTNLKQLSELNRMLLKQEKKELKQLSENIVDKEVLYETDSLASRKDSLFWISERQVPLTAIETKGFQQADSIYLANFEKINKKVKKDSIAKTQSNKFKMVHLISNKTFQFSKQIDEKGVFYKNNFSIGSFIEDTRFNAVEGVDIGINRLGFVRNFSRAKYIEFAIKPYYSINRNLLNGTGSLAYFRPSFNISAEGGRRVVQFNENNPISTLDNEIFSIFGNQHYGKFYEKTFLKLYFSTDFNSKWNASSSVILATRANLNNIVNQGFIRNDIFFESNRIFHANGISSDLNSLKRTNWDTKLSFSPKAQKTLFNNKLQVSNSDSPKIQLSNTLSFGNTFFGMIDLVAQNTFKLRFLRLYSKVNLGSFYAQRPKSLIDFKHFQGNQLFVASKDAFRDLAYYTFSSDKNYFQTFQRLEPNKFLFSQIPNLQSKGVSEYFFYNFLGNPYIHHHEIGYGLGLFQNNFAVEVYSVINNKTYRMTGFRLISKGKI